MSTEHIRFITVGFADLINNLPDPEVIASDPDLQGYWPDDLGEACAWCDNHVESGTGYYQASGHLHVFCDKECYVAWADSIGDDGPFSDD